MKKCIIVPIAYLMALGVSAIIMGLTGCTTLPVAVNASPVPSIQPSVIPSPIPVVAKPIPLPSLVPSTLPIPVSKRSLSEISDLAGGSSCAKYSWKNQGVAPKGYIKGMALTFAKAVCNQNRDDVKLVSMKRLQPEDQFDRTDVLSWYNSNFTALGMNNDKDSFDTYRHVFALLIGLGMVESSGRHCCGRDLTANFTSSDSAEAGLFQASWGASRGSSVLPAMFKTYSGANPPKCFLSDFSANITCSASNLKNWGSGDGFNWQAMTKNCPAFAAEYAAVVMRVSGGTKGEFGTLRRKTAEIKPECDTMLQDVQKLVQSDSSFCSLF